jgi:multidrug efflux pump subunit AcrB
MKETLRGELTRRFPDVRFSFEPADIISEVMSFGSTTPIEIAARGANLQENRAYLLKLQQELAALPYLRDIQFAQSLDYPTVDVRVDRERAGLSGASVAEVARSVVAATSSTRFVVPNYWPDPKTGIGYQVQLEIPQPWLTSADDLGAIPVSGGVGSPLLLRDIAQIQQGTMPGQYDRYNMKRDLSLTANISGVDLGRVSRDIQSLLTRLEKAGDKPASVTADVRGQIPPLRQILGGLASGLILALIVIVLLLTANFQSWRLALVTVTAAPAVLAGVVLSLLATGTTLNIQSLIGTIMSLGVAMANGILLVTFAEHERQLGLSSRDAAVQGAGGRLRPILMTSAAMIAGMIPMALGIGETGPQIAPLGRAVIGGLVAATAATLLVLPAVFALMQARTGRDSASLDPDDPASLSYDGTQPVPAGEE